MKTDIIALIVFFMMGFNLCIPVIQKQFTEDINATTVKADPLGDESFNNTNNLGYELLGNGSIFHMWNQYNNYYFNVSNGIQFTNHYQEYWTHNVLMLGYYDENEWNLIYRTDELSNFNRNITSETDDYINATLWKDLSYGGYDFRLALRYHLCINDSDLTVIPYIKNLGDTIPYVLCFGWEMKDIKIDNDYENDQIRINETSYLLNQTLDEKYTNITKTVYEYNETTNTTTNYTVKDGKFHLENLNNETGNADKDLYLKWDPNLDYLVWVKSRSGQYNAPTTLFIKVGILAENQEKSTELFWHDSDTLYERSNTGDNYAYSIYGTGWKAQTFTIGNTGTNEEHEITSVKLLIYRVILPGTFIVGIRAVDGSGLPTGEDLTSGSTDGDTLPTEAPYEWREIAITPYTLSASTKYAIVMRATGGDSSNRVKGRVDSTTPTYTGGSYMSSSDSGDTWTESTSIDFMFEEYGTTGPPPNNAPTITGEIPANTSTGISLTPICNVTANDDDGGDTLDVCFYENTSGSYVLQQKNASVNPGTSVQWDNYIEAKTELTDYYWMVTVDDATDNVSAIYHFTTAANSTWQTLDTWNITLSNTTQSYILDTWNLTLSNTSQSYILDTWNITLSNTTESYTLDTWNITLSNTTESYTLDTWNITLSNTTESKILDQWNITLSNLTISPYTLDTWNITLSNTPSPYTLDTWNLTLSNTTRPYILDRWNVTLSNTSFFSITDVKATPSEAVIDDVTINITCNVTSTYAIVNVTVNMTDGSYDMISGIGDLYYYNVINSSIGTHYYHIYANDTSGDQLESATYSFRIIGLSCSFTYIVNGGLMTLTPTITGGTHYQWTFINETGVTGQTSWIPIEDIGSYIQGYVYPTIITVILSAKNINFDQYANFSDVVTIYKSSFDKTKPTAEEPPPEPSNIFKDIADAVGKWMSERNSGELLFMAVMVVIAALFVVRKKYPSKKFIYQIVKKKKKKEKEKTPHEILIERIDRLEENVFPKNK